MSQPSQAEVWRQAGADPVAHYARRFRCRKSLEVTSVVDGIRLARLDFGATYHCDGPPGTAGPHGHFGQWWPT
jgi:hypothetical protein